MSLKNRVKMFTLSTILLIRINDFIIGLLDTHLSDHKNIFIYMFKDLKYDSYIIIPWIII